MSQHKFPASQIYVDVANERFDVTKELYIQVLLQRVETELG